MYNLKGHGSILQTFFQSLNTQNFRRQPQRNRQDLEEHGNEESYRN